LHQVVVSGTGAMATQKLGRPDLAGKTGTTTDAVDGWFAGYSGNLVAVSWMGYDEPKSLGSREFGATMALPAWIDYMRVALKGKPIYERPVPAGVVQNDGDWMYSEFVEQGAVKTVGMGDAPEVTPPPSSANPPTASPTPAVDPTKPTATPASPADQERQKAIDLFKNG
jgi:penicillin-binding protein 1A